MKKIRCLIFGLMLASLALSRIVLDERGDGHWTDWLLAGVALGLALLSKYHAALFAVGALIYFAFHPRMRVWLGRPQPYVAVLVALALFSPVIAWNAQNDWASFAFQLGRGAAVGHASLAIIGRLFLTEAAYLLPTTALLLLAAMVWSVLRRTEPRRISSMESRMGESSGKTRSTPSP
mgnify:CR=1 FL=1